MVCVYHTQYNINTNVTKLFRMQELSVTHSLLIVYSLWQGRTALKFNVHVDN